MDARCDSKAKVGKLVGKMDKISGFFMRLKTCTIHLLKISYAQIGNAAFKFSAK